MKPYKITVEVDDRLLHFSQEEAIDYVFNRLTGGNFFSDVMVHSPSSKGLLWRGTIRCMPPKELKEDGWKPCDTE